VISAFGELREGTDAHGFAWSEHCTECLANLLYDCDLTAPTRRKAGGLSMGWYESIVLPCKSPAKNSLKPWGNCGRRKPATALDRKAEKLENRDYRLAQFCISCHCPPVEERNYSKRYSFKENGEQTRFLRRGSHVLSVGVLQSRQYGGSLSLTIRSLHGGGRIPFQKLIDLKPGFR
jgi:hypothetical protein